MSLILRRIIFYTVGNREQLEQIHYARELQKRLNRDKMSYYIIEDLSTWADGSPDESRLERFDSLPKAIAKFPEYRGKDVEDKPDMARVTPGVSVNGIEPDLTLRGLPFILASVPLWLAILVILILPLPVPAKNLYIFFCSAPLVPFAYFISNNRGGFLK